MGEKNKFFVCMLYVHYPQHRARRRLLISLIRGARVLRFCVVFIAKKRAALRNPYPIFVRERRRRYQWRN